MAGYNQVNCPCCGALVWVVCDKCGLCLACCQGHKEKEDEQYISMPEVPSGPTCPGCGGPLNIPCPLCHQCAKCCTCYDHNEGERRL